MSHVAIYPASHYVVAPEKLERAIDEILKEMEERVEEFTNRKAVGGTANKTAHRIRYGDAQRNGLLQRH